MKKITLAVRSFSGGGAERVMVTLANKFIEFGYSVDFLVRYDHGPYRNHLDNKINKIVLANLSYRKEKRFWETSKALYTYFKYTPTSVTMSTIRQFNNLIIFLWLLSGKKHPLFVRETDTLDGIFLGSVKDRILLKCMQILYPQCSGVIANSNITRSDLIDILKLKKNHVNTLYNPLNLDKIHELKSNNKNKNVTLVACGRLTNKKNLSDIIVAFPLVKKRCPEAKLAILGEGPERDSLQAQIDKLALSQDVRLEGFVENPYEYYSKAHVFVQTSLWEGFGYVLVEAMACGTPVVAYDSKGAMREILEDATAKSRSRNTVIMNELPIYC